MGITTARRAWNIERNGRTYHVEMEDEYFLGRRVLRVDGKIVYSGRTVLSDHSGAYQFDLAGEPAFLRIRTNGFRYYYDLVAPPSRVISAREGPNLEQLDQETPGLTGIAGLLLFAFAMIASLVFIGDGRLWREPVVAAAGLRVDAMVTSAGRTTSDARRIQYHFEVGARSFTHEAFISRQRYDQALSLGVVPVRYLAIAPEISAFAPEPDDVLFDVLLGLVLAALAGTHLASTARAFGDYRVWNRLSTAGVETLGRITHVRTLRNQYMAAVGCAFEYTYSAGASDEFRGHSGRFPLDAAMYFPIGSTARIRYDPDRPGDSIFLTPSDQSLPS